MRKLLPYLALLVLAVLTLYFCIKYSQPKSPATGHTANRLSILQLDSLNTAHAQQRRHSLDSLAALLDSQRSRIATVYRDRVRYDTLLEIRYRNRPTPALCDSVLHSKNHRIGLLEQKDSLTTHLLAVKDSTITTQDGLLVQKNITIALLNDGYKEATQDLERLGKKRIVISAGVGYGIGQGFKPMPFAGVMVGWKLAEF